MIYKWKIPGVIPVDAQTAGEELQRIYQEKGGLNPSDIVEESRNDSAPLHPCFEWDDEIAAEKYRQTQAMQIVRSIVTIQESDKKKPQEVRAFVHVQESYHPISVVIGSKEQMERKYGGDLRFLLFNTFDTVLIYDKQSSGTDDLTAGQSTEETNGEDFSAQTSFYLGNWRFTPKVVYSNYEKRLVRGQLSESSKEITPSLTARLDFNLPRGIKLPFINRMYNATNRVIWNTTIAYTMKESPVEVNDNYDLLDITSSLDYEISQNLRLNLAGTVQWLKHAYVETEDYMAYNLAANVTIQF